MGAAPVLETERLVLRPFGAGDVDAQATMMSDPAVMRHIGGKGLSREEAWRKLLCGAGCWSVFGWGYWAIARRSDGVMIGQLGFADFKRDITPNVENVPEMGWLFAAEASGRGYATEAGLAALDWIEAAHDRPEVVAIIDEGNAPSIRVAEKLGFDERGPATYRDEPILLFRRRP
ncbi:MAG: GNAT family N-acetyltransferase [Alphaproteobacteria bacterium]|nr:MAG: GNAT family N-acetyltransferase [Alphaproteobacteria bacterium]